MSDKSLATIQLENVELKQENKGLKETLVRLVEELERIRMESSGEVPGPNRIILSRDEAIVDRQLKFFEALGLGRPLSLEEIRSIDILLKNKKELEKNRVVEPEWKAVSESTPETELLQLAGNSEEAVIPEKPRKRSKPKASSEDPLA